MKLAFYKNSNFAFELNLKESTAVQFPAGFEVSQNDTLQVITRPLEVSVNTIVYRLPDAEPDFGLTNDFSNDFNQAEFN